MKYEKAALKYKPSIKIKILFIAESPPHPKGDEEPRYFYFENVTKYDTLFREVTKILLPSSEIHEEKEIKLKKLQEKGIFLIDVCETPINHITPNSKRKKIIKENVVRLLKRLKDDYLIEKSTNIILISKNVYCVLLPYLIQERYNVLNTRDMEFLNFPRGGNNIKIFRAKLEKMLTYINL